MKKVLSFAALSLLALTACQPEYPTIPVPMSDPNVLSGTWTGNVTENHSPVVLGQDASHLFLRDGGAVSVYDLKTGQLQRSVTVPTGHIRYRQDGVIVVLTGTNLLTYDAVTLQPLETRPLPTSTGKNWQLSGDGSVLFNVNSNYAPQDRWLTTSLKALPTASVPDTDYYDSTLNTDQRWWLVYSKTQTNRTYRVIRADTGVGFTVAAKARNCTGLSALTSPVYTGPDLTVTSIPTTNDPEHSADQDLLVISFPDGTLEVRDAAGTVLRTVRVSAACSVVSLASTNRPGEVAFMVGLERGILNLNTGEVLQRFTATEYSYLTGAALSDGLFTVSRPERPTNMTYSENNFWEEVNPPIYGFRPWQGSAWTIPNGVKALTLNVQTTRVDDTKATVTGTLNVDGRSLQVSGNLGTMQSKLTSQGLPFMPGLYADLNVTDGTTTVGRLYLLNSFKVLNTKPVSADLTPAPVYLARWQPVNQGTTWAGLLRRP